MFNSNILEEIEDPIAVPIAVVEERLEAEALSTIPNARSFTNLLEIFRFLMGDRKLRGKDLHRRLVAFLNYLSTIGEKRSFLGKSISETDVPLSDLKTKCFRQGSSYLLQIFSLLFNLRIKLFLYNSDKLSYGSYGNKDGNKVYLLYHGKEFFLLQKSPSLSISEGKRSLNGLNLSISNENEADRRRPSNYNYIHNLKAFTSDENDFLTNKDKHNMDKCRTLDSIQTSPKAKSTVKKSLNPEKKWKGKLKFYNESKEYGFILFEDNSEIFIHKTDLMMCKINTLQLDYFDKFYTISMEFEIRNYKGKNKGHRKAVNIRILKLEPKIN